jgi:hypothetical protein
MCNCKQNPLQKAEMRLVANGWGRMSGSDMTTFDKFIVEQLGEVPINNENRPSYYAQAKHTQNHSK